MMYLTETDLFSIVKKQYQYKLKSYTGLFINMILVQIVALMLSFNGVGGSGMSSNYISLTVKLFSADLIIIFTLIWAFIVPTYLTTKAYRDADFAFVSNRLSSNLSNIAFLLTAGVVGAITANLSGYLIRVIAYLSSGGLNLVGQNFYVNPQELVVSILVTALYIVLISAIGYFFGMLVQLNKVSAVVLPALIIGSIIIEARLEGKVTNFIGMASFFVNESSFPVFVLKVLSAVVLLFAGAVKMANRMEVRQ